MLTARKRSLGQGNIFIPVCYSVYRGGITWAGTPAPQAGTPPWDQVHPRAGTPIWDQVHPLGPGTPPDQVHPYPLYQVHPHPQDRVHPPGPGTPPRQVHPP